MRPAGVTTVFFFASCIPPSKTEAYGRAFRRAMLPTYNPPKNKPNHLSSAPPPMRSPSSVWHRGWVFVAWQRRCKTSRSLRELDNQVTAFFLPLFFFCGDHNEWWSSRDCVVRGRERSLRATGMIAPRCVELVKHPRSSYKVLTNCLWK